jgi:hypothetical protein
MRILHKPVTTTKAGKKSFNDRFVDIADKVSYAIGTPVNIGFWIFAVVLWIALGPYFASHSFLPSWFTSNGFNFPLNTVTTLAELYIGFLVAAATNRAQKALTQLFDHMMKSLENDEIVQENLTKLIQDNTILTQQVHDLTNEIHEHVVGNPK